MQALPDGVQAARDHARKALSQHPATGRWRYIDPIHGQTHRRGHAQWLAENAVLRLIVGNAIASVRKGESSVEEAILHAAVHGWYEGHVQGEDECPGCDFRGQLPKGGNRG